MFSMCVCVDNARNKIISKGIKQTKSIDLTKYYHGVGDVDGVAYVLSVVYILHCYQFTAVYQFCAEQ